MTVTPDVAPSGLPLLVPSTHAVPECPTGGALVKLLGCGLCGSDVEKLVHGKAQPGQVLGHEVVGRVIAVDTEATPEARSLLGQRVAMAHHAACGQCHFCRSENESMCATFKATNFVPGGFASVIAIGPAHLANTVFLMPDTVSDAAASATEPLACVLKAMARGKAPGQQSVLIVGLGFIGLMAAQCYKQQGYWVAGIDINPERCIVAKDHGWVDVAVLPQDWPTTLKGLPLPAGGVDVVFLTVLSSSILTQALASVRDGGTLVQFCRAATEASLDTTPVYTRELRWVASYSPSMASLREAAQMIAAGKLQLDALYTHTRPLAELNTAITDYRTGTAIKVLLTPDELPLC